MRLSRKTDYALRAIFTLAEFPSGNTMSIRELARVNDVPRRFLEHIMLDLKERGWVGSVAGRDGGYYLAKSPDELTMGEIVRHFDGVLAPIGCVSVSNYVPCSQEGRCRFRRVLLEVRNFTAGVMDRATIGMLSRQDPVKQSEVFTLPLMDGAGI